MIKRLDLSFFTMYCTLLTIAVCLLSGCATEDADIGAPLTIDEKLAAEVQKHDELYRHVNAIYDLVSLQIRDESEKTLALQSQIASLTSKVKVLEHSNDILKQDFLVEKTKTDSLKNSPNGCSYETIAFWATRKTRFDMPHLKNFNITWPEVKLNIGGDYDPVTGMFTCRIPGVYMFTTSVDSYPPTNVNVVIQHDEIAACKAWASGKSDHTGTCSAILKMGRGEKVYVSKTPDAHSYLDGEELYAYFSGILMS